MFTLWRKRQAPCRTEPEEGEGFLVQIQTTWTTQPRCTRTQDCRAEVEKKMC